jgi:lysophospholipase L1-like esterase
MKQARSGEARFWILVFFPFLTFIISGEVQRIAMTSSDRIVFFGDSITEMGEQPNGYVALLRDTLMKRYPGISIVGAGISGNKVPQLQDRLDHDVLSKKPTMVVIYIGINDVWHFEKHGTGTPKEKYESGLRNLIWRIQKFGARVILCTPSVIGERRHGENRFDAMLDEYSGINRSVAKELGAKICDLRKAFFHYLAAHNPKNNDDGVLTRDSVHLNDAGNRLVAKTILKALEN